MQEKKKFEFVEPVREGFLHISVHIEDAVIALPMSVYVMKRFV